MPKPRSTPRPKARNIKIASPADIPNLPWGGNFAEDSDLFAVIDAYILDPATSLKDATDATLLSSLHGMGEKIERPRSETTAYVRECRKEGLPPI